MINGRTDMLALQEEGDSQRGKGRESRKLLTLAGLSVLHPLSEEEGHVWHIGLPAPRDD